MTAATATCLYSTKNYQATADRTLHLEFFDCIRAPAEVDRCRRLKTTWRAPQARGSQSRMLFRLGLGSDIYRTTSWGTTSIICGGDGDGDLRMSLAWCLVVVNLYSNARLTCLLSLPVTVAEIVLQLLRWVLERISFRRVSTDPALLQSANKLLKQVCQK